MAGETTLSTLDDSVFSEWMDSIMIEEIRPYNVMRPTFRYRGKEHANVFSFTLQDDPGVATAKAEGSSLSPTSMTSAKVQVTAGTIGQMATLTDELTAISLFDAYQHIAGVLWRSVAEKFETDATALLDDFSNTTGTSGADYTWAQRAEAIGALANRDAMGQLVEVLHTQQVNDLMQDLTTTTAAVFGNPNVTFAGVEVSQLQGYAFTSQGVPTLQTSLVPTADAGANRNGAIYVAGLALGHYEIWGPRTETDRDISLPGTEVVTTERYGVGVVRNTWGQGIKTDA